MEEGGFWGGMVVGIALTLLVIALLVGCARETAWDPNDEMCIRGGYAIWTSVKAEENGLCLGVDVNGKWKVETLADVWARMEGR